jgi:small-conductance mechanosensitive channel
VIGGIAVAFAFQSILKDLFSYFTILLDKPIRVGDYIYIADKKGKVKNIGVKTTRLKGVDGEEIVVANDMITSTDFKNFGKAKYRRVIYNIGVGYNTPVKVLRKLKGEIIKIVSSFEDVDLKRCHLRNLSDSSMDYEVVYHITTRDYDLYMNINEEINLQILELFEKKKVEIPFPTKTVYNRKG